MHRKRAQFLLTSPQAIDLLVKTPPSERDNIAGLAFDRHDLAIGNLLAAVGQRIGERSLAVVRRATSDVESFGDRCRRTGHETTTARVRRCRRAIGRAGSRRSKLPVASLIVGAPIARRVATAPVQSTQTRLRRTRVCPHVISTRPSRRRACCVGWSCRRYRPLFRFAPKNAPKPHF